MEGKRPVRVRGSSKKEEESEMRKEVREEREVKQQGNQTELALWKQSYP